jgi:hypothetical protein
MDLDIGGTERGGRQHAVPPAASDPPYGENAPHLRDAGGCGPQGSRAFVAGGRALPPPVYAAQRARRAVDTKKVMCNPNEVLWSPRCAPRTGTLSW